MKYFISLAILLCSLPAFTQQAGKNLVVVTIDGIRWQELFKGADEKLLFSSKYIQADSAETMHAYWAATEAERREKIFPFIWGILVKQGQVYGNRAYDNIVQLKNPYAYSYPGYNEIFSGFADTAIKNNDGGANVNEHVLGFISRQPGFKNKVAAFTNWTKFGDILNPKKGEFFLSYGNLPLPKDLLTKNHTMQVLNDMQPRLPALWETDRYDALTYAIAKEYMKMKKPRVLYISLGEADEWAHASRYDLYLDAARKADEMIQDLWQTLQLDPFYKNNTYLLITTDHGRGLEAEWTSHKGIIAHSNETWFAVYGPGIAPLGEMTTPRK
ncbi:MAG: hypothetical protein ABIT96_13445, partial [Ferruginibacter sp.]